MNKKCFRCKNFIPTQLFWKDKQKKDGLFSSCKPCNGCFRYTGFNHERENNPMFGKKHSEETKEKIRSKTFKRDKVTFLKSEIARKNMSIGKIKWWEEHPQAIIIASERNKGEKGSNWQGGKTTEVMTIRTSSKYNQWRKAVFERDNYTCIFCNQRGGKLNADHIKPFSLFPELRLNLENGRTLCLNCHKKTDTWAGKIKSYVTA